MRFAIRRAGAACLALLLLPLAAFGQGSRLPGAVETGLLLRQLDGVKRILMVAAHPDDEDTALLATLARGWGAETAYFSFTRGEGGQNLIGTELGEGLGMIRTGELLAARQIDGAGQYFGRAFDFGYSKTAEETFAHWPRDALLSDLVWVIRVFRPHVVISMWSGTPRDGHGHHQASGILAREAWEAAGDPSRFAEQLERVEPWAPLKLYRRTLFDPDAATLGVETGRLDPLLGRSHHQVAMESRSRHRSQDFGTAQTPGPRTSGLDLVAARVRSEEAGDLLAGVDTTLASLLPRDEEAPADLSAYRGALVEAASDLVASDPARSLPALVRARRALDRLAARVAGAGDPGGELDRELARRRVLLDRALLAATGVRVELRARDDVLTPGQTVLLETRVWSGREAEVRTDPPVIDAPPGWEVRAIGPGDEVPPDETGPFGRFFQRDDPVARPGAEIVVPAGELRLWRYLVTVPVDAPPTAPYFLVEPRDGALYRWPDDPAVRALPFRPPLLGGVVGLDLEPAGASIRVEARGAFRYRGVSGTEGEFWRPLQVAPRVSVTPGSRALIWPLTDRAPRDVTFRVTSHAPDPTSGTLEPELPGGWTATPAARSFELAGEGAGTTLGFRVAPAREAVPGELRIGARLTGEDGQRPALDVSFIDYPHIESRLLASETAVRIVHLPVAVAERSVGYVMGSGDEGPAAIRQLGLDVELIEPGGWERLDRFDTVVLGVRAYEVRPDLIAAQPLLLDWVERGGTLIVQYNRYEFNDGDYAPYPLSIGRPAPRVTDETAEVTLLEPEALPFREPNRIGPADFEGWVQERGLYFPTEWDARYRELLELSDPGEEPLRGSLLVAPYGEGLYIHTSLSFFRQLPAGVPGAFRLFANLLSLDGRRWRSAS